MHVHGHESLGDSCAGVNSDSQDQLSCDKSTLSHFFKWLRKIGPLSLITWNAQSLLGGIKGHATRLGSKLARWASFFDNRIVFVQEARGSEASLATLAARCPSHVHRGSFLPLNAGGVLISFDKLLVKHCSSYDVVEVVPGRVLALQLWCDGVMVQFCNVHLDIGHTCFTNVVAMVGALAAFLRRWPHAITFFWW